MRKIALAVLALALSSGCVSTESARKVKMPWWSGFIGGGGGSAFNGTLAAGVPLTLTGATSGTLALTIPATGASGTLTLPATHGSAGQVLTDAAGNGTLSWATPNGGATTGVTGWPNAVWSTGGTFTYTAANVTFQSDSDSYVVTPNSSTCSIHTAAANLYWGLHTSSDTINRDLWYAHEISSTGGGFEFSPVTDAKGSLGWNTAWLNSIIYRMGIPQATLDRTGFGTGYSLLATDSATHKLALSENNHAFGFVMSTQITSTGSTTATLGTACPGATAAANTWISITLADGSTAYVPVWK